MSMETPEFSKVTRILTSGTWFEIKKGSLEPGTGILHVNVGAVEPLYRFRFPDGEAGAILARRLDGWAPLHLDDAPARPASMQEFDEPLRIRGLDGTVEPNPFAQGRRALSGSAPLGLNRP